jgi:hypothetical protein
MMGPVNLLMEATELTEPFESVIKPSVGHPALAKNGGDASQLYICGLALQPAFEEWLQLIAVRAAVPEKFDDLDPLTGRRQLRRD